MSKLNAILAHHDHKMRVIDRDLGEDLSKLQDSLDYLTAGSETITNIKQKSLDKKNLDEYMKNNYDAAWDPDAETYIGVAEDSMPFNVSTSQAKALQSFSEYEDMFPSFDAKLYTKDKDDVYQIKTRYSKDPSIDEHVENMILKVKRNVKVSKAATKGRRGDTKVINIGGKPSHVSEFEYRLVKQFGERGEQWLIDEAEKLGGPTINPYTGYPEYWEAGAGFMKNLGGMFGEEGFFGKAMDFMGGPWGKLVTGFVGEVFGASKKRKAARKKVKGIKESIGLAETQVHETANRAVEALGDMHESFSEELESKREEFGEGAEEIVGLESSLEKATKGLVTGSAETKVEEGTTDLVEGYDEIYNNLISSYEQGHTAFSDKVSDALFSQNLQQKQLADELKYWQKQSRKKLLGVF